MDRAVVVISLVSFRRISLGRVVPGRLASNGAQRRRRRRGWRGRDERRTNLAEEERSGSPLLKKRTGLEKNREKGREKGNIPRTQQRSTPFSPSPRIRHPRATSAILLEFEYWAERETHSVRQYEKRRRDWRGQAWWARRRERETHSVPLASSHLVSKEDALPSPRLSPSKYLTWRKRADAKGRCAGWAWTERPRSTRRREHEVYWDPRPETRRSTKRQRWRQGHRPASRRSRRSKMLGLPSRDDDPTTGTSRAHRTRARRLLG